MSRNMSISHGFHDSIPLRRCTMIRMMKFSLLLWMALPMANALVIPTNDKVSCYLTKIDQGYPHDSIPAIGVVEFSTAKIKVPVQYFGQTPTIWESSLTTTTGGTLKGGHFWNIQIIPSGSEKMYRLSLEFENPTNVGLINEESIYSAEFECGEFNGRQLLSENMAMDLIKEYSQKKFPNLSLEFESLRVTPEKDGCNQVIAFSKNTKICSPAEKFAGTFVSIKVCDEKIVKSGFHCDDY